MDGQTVFSSSFRRTISPIFIYFLHKKMAAARVFSGYRRLFRARKILFQGDDKAMRESRVEIRKQFEMNRAASDPAHIEGLLTMVDEAEDMLLHGIVRGELNDQTGNYGECTAFEFLAMMPSLFFSGKSFADFFFSLLAHSEVKIKAEHASDDGAATATNNLEPITAETADKMEGKVTVTTSSSKGSKDKS